MGRPSSGIAKAGLVTGIIGTAGAVMNNNGCNNGILGNILGGNNNNCYETKEAALLRQELATCKADQATDGKILELYQYNETQFKERDTVTNGALIELGKESVRNEYARADIVELKAAVKAHSAEISDLNSSVSVLSERVTGVAMSLTQKIEAQGKELAAAIGLEAERRECADNNIYAYINGHFVPGKLVMPLDAICPEAMPRCETAGAVRVQSVK